MLDQPGPDYRDDTSPSRGTENRTLLSRLKAGCFAKKLYPQVHRGMRFQRLFLFIVTPLFCADVRKNFRPTVRVVALRIELSALFLSERVGLPALDDRCIRPKSRDQRDVHSTFGLQTLGSSLKKVGYLGVEPKTSWSQTRRAPTCTSARYCLCSLDHNYRS